MSPKKKTRLIKFPAQGDFFGFYITIAEAWRDPCQGRGYTRYRLWSIGWLRCWYVAPERRTT